MKVQKRLKNTFACKNESSEEIKNLPWNYLNGISIVFV